jgi:hypothetical protein
MPTTYAIIQGNRYIDATLYTGTGANATIVNAGVFKPDLVWMKSRSAVGNHELSDSVRGVQKYLRANDTTAETSDVNSLQSFNSNGFSVGIDGDINGSGKTIVAWQWAANQGSNVTNTTGTITSTVSANVTSGFSIVTYTGSGANATVGHGLGAVPALIFVKQRTLAGFSWIVYSASIGATNYLALNLTNASAADSTVWNNTNPTSSVFSLGTGGSLNNSGNNFVAYCWAPVAGFSAFGSYIGNGSIDGPFIYTGFRPKFVMTKKTSTTGYWWIQDTSRAPNNAANALLFPNATDAEYTTAGVELDILSNGFKIRNTNADQNANTSSYVYMAFAETPFKYANAR